ELHNRLGLLFAVRLGSEKEPTPRMLFSEWISRQAALISRWGWEREEQWLLLLRMQPELADAPAWEPLPGESPEATTSAAWNASTRCCPRCGRITAFPACKPVGPAAGGVRIKVANACALTTLRYAGRTRALVDTEDCTGRRAVGAFPAAGGVHTEVANACALTILRYVGQTRSRRYRGLHRS